MKQEMFLRYRNLPLLKINVCVFFSLFPSVNRHLQYIKKTGPHVWRQLHGTCVFQQEHLAATWMMSRGEESRWNWDADCAAKSVFNRKNRLKVTEQCGRNQKKKQKKKYKFGPKTKHKHWTDMDQGRQVSYFRVCVLGNTSFDVADVLALRKIFWFKSRIPFTLTNDLTPPPSQHPSQATPPHPPTACTLSWNFDQSWNTLTK